jgi:hypothetical protein
MPLEFHVFIKTALASVGTFINIHSGIKNTAKISEILEIASKSLNLHIYVIRQKRLNAMELSKRHIMDAFLASSEESRKISIEGASSILAELVDLPVDEQMPGEEVEYNNRPLISWGYWGRFCIFCLLNDNRNALRQVYECSSKYPEISVNLFDPSLFPKLTDYTIVELCQFDSMLTSGRDLPSTCIYHTLPNNLAKSLINISINEFKQACTDILVQIEYI